MKNGIKFAVWLITFIPMVVYLFIYNNMGNTVPVSWNEFGEATSYITKTLALYIIPILPIFITFLLFFIKKIRGEDKLIFGITFDMFMLFTAMTFTFVALFPIYLVAFNGGDRYDFLATILAIISFLVFVCGFIFPKFKYEGKYGFITPWTKADKTVFNKTQQVASISFVIGALFLGATTLFVHDYKTISVLTFILITLIITFIPLLYSKKTYENQ